MKDDHYKLLGIYLIAVLVLLLWLCSCTTTQYVPVETVRTEHTNRTDTIIQKDTVEKEKTVTIMEADSALLAKYGILLRENRNTQAAYLIIQKELEREKSKRQEVHTDTIVKTEIVQVPVPVERELSRWEHFCLDYGKVMAGGSVVCVILIMVYLVRRIRKRKR